MRNEPALSQLPPFAKWPAVSGRGLLRGLRPVRGIGRKLADSEVGEAPHGSQVHGGSIDTSRTAPPVRQTRSVTGLVVGTTGVRASAHRLISQRCHRALRARRPDDSTLARPVTGGPTIGASCSGFFRSHRDVLASSPGRGQALPGHMVREASDEILLRVLPPALVATCALFTGLPR